MLASVVTEAWIAQDRRITSNMRMLDTGSPEKASVNPSGVIPIKSVERAMLLLSLFSANDTVPSLGEIARRLSMSCATTHRYCVSLRETGLLHYDPAPNVYVLGPLIIVLDTAALNGFGFLKITGPYLERLVSLTNETTVMSIWDGEAPLVVWAYDATDRWCR